MNKSLSRRDFLRLASLSALGLSATGATLASSKVTTSDVELSELSIPIPNLPPAFAGYRLGFISDIHANSCVNTQLVETALSLLATTQCNALLIGGDFIWLADRIVSQTLLSLRHGRGCRQQGQSYEKDHELAEILYLTLGKLLNRTRYPDGMFAVYGNHDYWVAPHVLRNTLLKCGINVLVNQAVSIRRGSATLSILGTDDFWNGTPAVTAWKLKKKPNEVRVLLTHNPDYFSRLLEAESPDFDLGLAGHTHGGQIKLPLIGALHYNVQDRRFAEGLFKHERAWIYTSRGIGVVGLPVRINCPAEVAALTLKQA